jgi:flavin-binding protein dodecin
MPARRETKVRTLRPRAGATTGRGATADFAAETALLNRGEAVNPDDHVYRVIEIVGTSETGIDDAISSAIARASQTLRHLRWFEVLRTSGHIVDGGVKHYQVTLKVGFTMEGPH